MGSGGNNIQDLTFMVFLHRPFWNFTDFFLKFLFWIQIEGLKSESENYSVYQSQWRMKQFFFNFSFKVFPVLNQTRTETLSEHQSRLNGLSNWQELRHLEGMYTPLRNLKPSREWVSFWNIFIRIRVHWRETSPSIWRLGRNVACGPAIAGSDTLGPGIPLLWTPTGGPGGPERDAR